MCFESPFYEDDIQPEIQVVSLELLSTYFPSSENIDLKYHEYTFTYTQGNYAIVGSAIVAIAIVGRGGWAGLSSTVAI